MVDFLARAHCLKSFVYKIFHHVFYPVLLLAFWLNLIVPVSAQAEEKTVNIFVYEGLISEQTLRAFEKETGIQVNLSSFDSNETLYTKLKTLKTPLYDVIITSTYYLERLKKANLLHEMDLKKIPNLVHLDPFFLESGRSKQLRWGVPFCFGITGILINRKYPTSHPVLAWSDLWDKSFYNRLLLLDEMREVFGMALIRLGYSPNDNQVKHIEQAYTLLAQLVPNIKLYAGDTSKTIYIDEDARIGMVWNGDVEMMQEDNPNLDFLFPRDGFMIWVDVLSIVSQAPHVDNAYQFLNFLMRPEQARLTTLQLGYATTNRAAQEQLPESLRKNLWLFPSRHQLNQGVILTDLDEQAYESMLTYWQKLKMMGAMGQ